MFYFKALIGITVVAAMLLAYNHYNNVLHELAGVRQELTIKQIETEIFKEAKESYRLQAESLSQAMNDMADETIEAEMELERLQDVQRSHDIEALAKARPGLIERRINDGTARVFGMFEDATSVNSGDSQ
jgi:hypothetical protein